MQQGFVHLVERTVQETGMKPCDLRLEITETTLNYNPRDAGGLALLRRKDLPRTISEPATHR